MTQHEHNTPQDATPEQQSLSGLLDHPELLRVRILPAQFARAMGVSKQSVSRWVHDGWVTLAADGRLDPTVAIGQLLRRCDPGRLRARWLRQAVTEVQALREGAASADERVAAVEADLAGAKLQALREARLADKLACTLDRLFELLLEREGAMRATSDSSEWRDLVEHLDAVATAACDDDLDALADDADDALDALTARDAAALAGGVGD